MIGVAYILLITSTALLMGNEFSVAAFIHPSLSRADHRSFIPAIQVFARMFGRIMPFWMAGTLILHLALAWVMWTAHSPIRTVHPYAVFIWAVIVVFSVALPVPINNRVGRWNPLDLPSNWESERKLWDFYNSVRVFMIGVAFILLLVAYKNAA